MVTKDHIGQLLKIVIMESDPYGNMKFNTRVEHVGVLQTYTNSEHQFGFRLEGGEWVNVAKYDHGIEII